MAIKIYNNFFQFILLANIIGILWGVIAFYGKQLETVLFTEPWMAIFVPDSPLQTLFITIALGIIWFEIKWKKINLEWFKFFALAGVIKNSIWTTYVLVRFQEYYFHPEIATVNGILLIAHILLGLEALLLLGRMEFKYKYLMPVIAWFFVGDFMDYVFNMHPPLPAYGITEMFSVTLTISIIALFIGMVLARHFNRKIAVFEFENAQS